MEKDAPKVSVCIVTYNQKNYIRECLESILNQKTSFEFEIVVADDCSSDGTQDVLIEYSMRYPTIVKLHLHTMNMGPYKNFVFVHKQALGEYIAHIDGDDYCLPGKLQMQSDLLDLEHECNIVWHKMIVEEPSGTQRENSQAFASNMKFYRGDILQYISIGANSSKMYRRSVREFEEPHFDVVDYFANVEQVGSGYARLVDDRSYGVYRAGIGISASGNKTRLILGDCFSFFAKKYPQYSSRVNSAALIYFLADFKNGRKSWLIFWKIWLRTFSYKSIFGLKSHLEFARRISKG